MLSAAVIIFAMFSSSSIIRILIISNPHNVEISENGLTFPRKC